MHNLSMSYSVSNRKNAPGDSFCLKILGATSWFPMHHSWLAIDDLGPGELIGLDPADYNNGVFLWSLEEDLLDVVPMIFHHGEVAQMSVYRKYVGSGVLRGRKTVYEVVAYIAVYIPSTV
ncbi:hypothetical protein ACLB2K_073135 [Fragaria x ananassa]